MPRSSYGDSVFINCPFDSGFTSLFRAINFAVQDCGFVSRCALETDDAAETRISKIERIIEDCRFGVHDGSAMRSRNRKCAWCWIATPFATSSSARTSRGSRSDRTATIELAIRRVRDWLRDADSGNQLPGGASIAERYKLFLADLPDYCASFRLREDELTFKT